MPTVLIKSSVPVVVSHGFVMSECSTAAKPQGHKTTKKHFLLMLGIQWRMGRGWSLLPGQHRHHSTNRADKEAQSRAWAVVMAEGQRKRKHVLIKASTGNDLTFHWVKQVIKLKIGGAEKCIHD